MARKMTTTTADGGTISIEEKGKGFVITVQRGFKETPEERKERIRLSKRGGFHSDKREASRARVKQELRSGKW